MVHDLLRLRRAIVLRTVKAACAALLLLSPAWGAKRTTEKFAEPAPPDLLLEGGRKLSWAGSLRSEREVRTKQSFWSKLVGIIAGEPDVHYLVRPYDVAMDSRGRLVVTDPGAFGVHIFDLPQHKYKFIQRKDVSKDPLLAPQGVAVDAEDNIYVTDSESGKIFVFNHEGKFQHALGSLKGGEGFFKRPTGIAVDSAAQRIYVSDTLRNRVFALDLNGNVIQVIGQRGTAPGQFNFPTELLLAQQYLAVVDAMNFRVQVFDRSGSFQYAIGTLGDGLGELFRPKGIGFDSEGHLYVLDGLRSIVQVFNHEGQLLYYFGQPGASAGQFQLPTGLLIDGSDRIYVVDSYNRRVQVFRYFGRAAQVNRGNP